MLKILSFTRKTLLEYLREPLLWGLILAFPPLMVVLMYVAFGQPQQGMARSLRVLVTNGDTGPRGAELVQALRAMTFEGQPIFQVDEMDDTRRAEVILQERRAALWVTVPPDFSSVLGGYSSEGRSTSANLILAGDSTSFNYLFARSFFDDLVDEFLYAATQQPKALTPAYEFIPGTGKTSDFDIATPGVVVFGLLFLTISTATTLVREHVANTLQRLRLTQAHAGHIVFGVALAQLLIALIQIPVAFGTAVAYGFGSSGNLTVPNLVLALAICLLFSLSVIGVGLMVAAFARNDGEASNLAMLPLVPMAFLSGAIYPMPPVPLFTLGGHGVGLYDFMSSTHAAEALRQILVYGKGPGEIGYSLFMLAFLTLVYLALGIRLYQRFKLK